MSFFFHYKDLSEEIVEGDVKRYINTAEKMQVLYYKFPPNKKFPLHSHDENEQIGFLVKGTMRLVCGGEERIMKPGDFYCAPIGVEHWAETMDEPAELLDIFAPPRKDLIK